MLKPCFVTIIYHKVLSKGDKRIPTLTNDLIYPWYKYNLWIYIFDVSPLMLLTYEAMSHAWTALFSLHHYLSYCFEGCLSKVFFSVLTLTGLFVDMLGRLVLFWLWSSLIFGPVENSCIWNVSSSFLHDM